MSERAQYTASDEHRSGSRAGCKRMRVPVIMVNFVTPIRVSVMERRDYPAKAIKFYQTYRRLSKCMHTCRRRYP